MIATNPAGWVPEDRLEIPAYGGEFSLPSGAPAFAEPLDRDGAFLVRRLEHAPAGSSGGAAQLRLLGDERPCVVVDGRSIALGRRQAEILALLCLRPSGLTTEQLGTEVYGDEASNSTVRGEVSRLRKQLGLAIETDPYRLAGHVESDLGRVRTLLLRGAIREAAERYAGPLLPHSDAPGVERERYGARGLDAPRGDDGRGPRRALGVGPDALRRGRPGGLEARAFGAGLPRPAAQPGGGAGRAAARPGLSGQGRLTYDPAMAHVHLREPLKRLAGNRSEHALEGTTVAEVLLALERAQPALDGWILDERDVLRRHINVFVNGELGGPETQVAAEDRARHPAGDLGRMSAP